MVPPMSNRVKHYSACKQNHFWIMDGSIFKHYRALGEFFQDVCEIIKNYIGVIEIPMVMEPHRIPWEGRADSPVIS